MRGILFKKILAIIALALGLTLVSDGQSITLTAPPTPSVAVNLSWDAPVASGSLVGCDPTTNICVYNVYRIPGSCPNPVLNSTGWSNIGTTAESTLNFTDNSVAPATVYSYTVEAILESDLQSSGPSNCVTVTTGTLPLVPSAPVLSNPLGTSQTISQTQTNAVIRSPSSRVPLTAK